MKILGKNIQANAGSGVIVLGVVDEDDNAHCVALSVRSIRHLIGTLGRMADEAEAAEPGMQRSDSH